MARHDQFIDDMTDDTGHIRMNVYVKGEWNEMYFTQLVNQGDIYDLTGHKYVGQVYCKHIGNTHVIHPLLSETKLPKVGTLYTALGGYLLLLIKQLPKQNFK